MKTARHKIIMPLGGQMKLAQDFGVTRRMIYKALTFRGNSLLAQKIRASALESGGELYEVVPANHITKTIISEHHDC